MIEKKDILQEYVECKSVIKETETRMKDLQEMIKSFAEIDDVFDMETAKVSYVKGKPRYNYSPELTEREKQVKADQKEEVQTGIAEVVFGDPFLLVKFK